MTEATPNFSFDFAYAGQKPSVTGKIKTVPEHFVVEEFLPFEPSGEGEHEYLYIEKRGLNTEEVVKAVARHGQLHKRDVNSAGLKDKWAVTRQWICATVINKDVDWSTLENDRLKILKRVRHAKKLRKGVIDHNRFQITVADLVGDHDALQASIERIARDGVPNYFGEQRFGNGGQNLVAAQQLFSGEKKVKNKHLRGIYLSSARSYLFNHYLSQRVAQGNWNQRLEGDVFMLSGTHSIFTDSQWQTGDNQRLVDLQIHSTGPLFGRGASLATDESLALEHEVTSLWQDGCAGLDAAGMKQERRSLRMVPENLSYDFSDNQLIISFELPAGCFATSVLRELVCVE